MNLTPNTINFSTSRSGDTSTLVNPVNTVMEHTIKGRMRRFLPSAFLALAVVVISGQAEATITTYLGDKTGFDGAVAGLSGVTTNVLDFEAQTAGSSVTEGSTLGGFTLSTNLPTGYQMGINGAGSTSGLNSLAVSPPTGGITQFGLTDRIDVNFAASHAFGFYLVVGDAFDFYANDVNVTFGGTTLSIADSTVATSFSGGKFGALWLGIVDNSATHTSATIQFGKPGDSFVSIGELDDLTTTARTTVPSVPEPSTMLLMGSGVIGLLGWRRRKHR